MKIRKMAFALALLLLLGAVIALPGTIAYIAAKSNTVTNTFTALHYPPDDTSVTISVKKIVHNVGTERISPEGFQFVLAGADNERHTLTVDRKGNASITLPFSEADLGNTYEYQLFEINDGREKVTYDRTVYQVSITIALDENENALLASVKVNGEAAQPTFRFENTYAAGKIVPPTGDEMNITLCFALMLMSAVCAALLTGRKAKQ